MAITTTSEAKKFVLKAYKTEANARADENPLLMTSPSDEEGSIVDNPSQATSYGYWAFQRYYYRIESNEPVSEFYIDWDDGEDNSKEKANVSIIKNEKPSFFGITSHIYTQSKKFYPLIRVKSVDGFLSKWYTSHAGSNLLALNTFSGLDDTIKTTATGGQVYDSGQNSFSVVSVEQNDDSTAYARIPVLEPANVPPIGVLKTDRKRLFSNIDNDLLGKSGRMLQGQGISGGTAHILPYTDTVTAYCTNPARVGVQVKVTYQEAIIGGVKAVASIQIVAKGPLGGGGEFYNQDLDDAAIFIKTMDAHYCCFWNADSRQASGTTIPNFDPDVHTPVIAVPSAGSGNTGVVTTAQLVSSMVNALNAVKFPASTGRTEFTATGTSDGDVEQITITNLREGEPATGAWITVQNNPLGNYPMDAAGYGVSGVRINGTGEGAGVSPSGGNIKQKTLTTVGDKNTSSAKIESVENILKVELVNNLEATDSYKGTSQTTKLYPGEKVYLLSSIGIANNYNLPTLTGRNLDTNIHNTICHVSLGNPITTLNDVGGHTLVDGSESKVRCSNKSLSFYYFDDNKLISGDDTESDGGSNDSHMSLQNNQEADTTDASWGISDKLVDGIEQKTTVSARELRYSNEWFREHTDSNYRFYAQKRLIRCQVNDNHTQVAEDSFSRSPIEHWDPSGYLSASAAADLANGQPSEIAKHNYGALIFTNKAQARAPDWSDLKEINRSGREPIFHCAPTSLNVNDTPYNNQLLASTSFDTHTDFSDAADHYEPDNRSSAMAVGSGTSGPDNVNTGPRNALFMAKKEKYDRLFVRVSHDLLNAGALETNDIANNPTPGTTACMPKVRLQILYPAKKTSVVGSSEDKVVWKALPYIDRTNLKGKDDSTFYKSGDITFVPPSDWAKTSHSTMNTTAATDTNIIYPFEDNFFEDGSGATGINDVWTQDSYALIFLITVINQGEEAAKNCFSIMSILPYNNSHSQLIDIVDPAHVSLNKYGIAQSVSFVRKGKYQEIKDRSGISQMRRIGAEGGAIKLGSIDLSADPHTTRAKFNEFQQDAVPVYYDVTHKDNSITRMFGTMTDMSEDHPTGNIIPKFACTLKITHMVEIDSNGNLTKDGYLPLGGDVVDVSQYLSAA